MINQKLHDAICRKLVDEGKFIEAGWVALRFTLPADAPPIQLEEMRKAFFAGAQHLFAGIMSILEPGAEATAKDLHRMTVIAQELRHFGDDLKRKRPNWKTYEIAEDGKSILCLRCGMRSWYPEDVRQLYCGNCHTFHERSKN